MNKLVALALLFSALAARGVDAPLPPPEPGAPLTVTNTTVTNVPGINAPITNALVTNIPAINLSRTNAPATNVLAKSPLVTNVPTTNLPLAGPLLTNSLPVTGDTNYTRVLVGTWVNDPGDKERVSSTVSYNADGTGFELIRPGAGPGAHAAIRVDTQWSITNGVLTIKCVKATDPMIPVNLVLKDRIISMTEDRFVFETLEGYPDNAIGKKHVRLKKKRVPLL